MLVGLRHTKSLRPTYLVFSSHGYIVQITNVVSQDGLLAEVSVARREGQGIVQSQLRRYALFGAEARLKELEAEVASIRRAFPELGTRAVPSASAGTIATPSRRRRGMSAANRKAVSERMKKYWTERRAQTSDGAGAAASAGTQKRASKRGRSRKAAKAAKRGARKMSAAARKRISDAQKARWPSGRVLQPSATAVLSGRLAEGSDRTVQHGTSASVSSLS